MLPLDISYAEPPAIHLVRIETLAEQVVGEKLVADIYKRAGIRLTITPMPAKRAIMMAVKGKKDGEMLRIWNFGEKYPDLIRVPTPISSLKTQAFAVKTNNIQIKNKNDLSLYRLAYVRGVQHTTDITAGFDRVFDLPSARSLMRFIQVGRADVALTSRINGLAILKKYALNDIAPTGPTLGEKKLYNHLYKKFAHLVPVIDAVIKSMHESGELYRLRQKYEFEYLSGLI